MHNVKLYTTVCWLFAIAFFITMVALAVVPAELAALMNWGGEILGLSGKVTVGVGNLDYVLALSLMGCIVALGAGSAVNPEPKTPYLALLVAKAISTGGFGLLAVQAGTVWGLAAVADGLVIVGLVLARHLSFPEEMVDEVGGMA